MAHCIECSSENIKAYKYMDEDCYRCSDCGHDSCAELDDVPGERSSQRKKGKYSPYKTGGSKRTK